MRSKRSKSFGSLPPLAPPEDWGGIRIALFFVLSSVCFAQSIPPDSVWTFAWDDGGDEYFYDAVEVDDGFILCGEAREWNALAGEGIIVKLDFSGQLVWEQRHFHTQTERFPAIVKRGENDYLVGCERVASNGRSTRLRIYEVNDFGNVNSNFWHELGQDVAYPVRMGNLSVPTTNNFATSYSLELFEGERMFILEISDRVGNSQLRYFSSGALNDNAGHTVIDSATFESVLFGATRSEAGEPADGLLEYEGENSGIYGGPGEDMFLAAVHDALHARVVATGFQSDSNTGRDLWVTSTVIRNPDSALWSRHYGGLAYEDGVGIVNASDSGYIIAGNYSSEDIEFEQSDFWLLKVDENGDSVWSVVAGRDEADRSEGMIRTTNGFLLFGASQSFAVPGWDACAMLLAYVPDLAAAPASLNFGPVQVGDSVTRVLSLINTGSNTLTVTEIVGTAAYRAELEGPLQIALGETLAVNVVFTPLAAGTRIDTLHILSDALSGEKIVRCLGAGLAVSAEDAQPLVREFKLHPPYPNPFNPATTLAFDLPKPARVELTIFDVQGRVITTLLDGDLASGTHTIEWNCSTCAGGVYFARLRASEFEGIQKLVLLK